MSNKLLIELIEAVKENRLLIPDKDRIYLVNDTTVGKEYQKEKHAYNEYTIGNLLFNEGVSVPEMYQLVPPEPPLHKWYVLMQKIKGIDPCALKGDEFLKAIQQYEAELSRVLELGIYPGDQRLTSPNLILLNLVYQEKDFVVVNSVRLQLIVNKFYCFRAVILL